MQPKRTRLVRQPVMPEACDPHDAIEVEYREVRPSRLAGLALVVAAWAGRVWRGIDPHYRAPVKMWAVVSAAMLAWFAAMSPAALADVQTWIAALGLPAVLVTLSIGPRVS